MASRLWLLAVASISLVGCKPADKAVFIRTPVFLPISSPKPVSITTPKPMGSVAITLPELPEREIADPSDVSEAQVRGLIKREQDEAYRNLVRRLRDVYAMDAKRQERELQRGLTEKTRLAFNGAQIQIRKVFIDYADHRGPVVARLAFLVGHPDPNPASYPPEHALRPLPQRYFDESKRLRDQLSNLAKNFDFAVKGVLEQMALATAQDRLDMVLRLQKYRDLLDTQADREAKETVQSVTNTMNLKLLRVPPHVLPGSPAQTVTIPAGDALPGLNEVTFLQDSPVPSVAEQRVRWEGKLRIWLALNHFARVDKPDQGRDATAEFEQWMQNY